jgi:hypothetical protein
LGFYYADGFRPPKELMLWHAKTDAQGIATFDWIPLKDLAGISFEVKGGWNEANKPAPNVAVAGEWEKFSQKIEGDLGYIDPDRDKYEQIDWAKLFEKPLELKVKIFTFASPLTVSVRDRAGEPICWTPVVWNENYKGQTDFNGELEHGISPDKRMLLAVESRFGAAPGVFDFPAKEGVTKVDITLDKGTKLFGKMSLSDGKTMTYMRFDIWETHPDCKERIRRSVRTQQDSKGNFEGPYEVVLPPGRFEVEVESGYWDGTAHVFRFAKTLVLDGSKAEIELDIVLEEIK